MHFPIAFAVFLFLFSQVTHGIIGGEPAPDYPFFAVVQRGDHMCGGTLVRLNAVLTAAHCLYYNTENRWASPIEVYVLHGDVSTPNNWTLRYHFCENFYVHHHYQTSTQGVRSPFDVAVIKLVDEVHLRTSFQRTTLPVCRSDAYKRLRNMYGIAIGLGFTNLNPPVRAERLMQTSIQRMHCRDLDIEDPQFSHPVQVCYSFLQGSSITDTDLGSPMIVKKGDVALCLIGASSFNIYSHKKGFFANVFSAGGKLRCWLHRIFRENFTYEDLSANDL